MKTNMIPLMCVAAALAGCSAATDSAPSVTSRPFGESAYGEKVTAWTVKGAGGLELEVLDLGGIVNRILVPGPDGKKTDVTIGFDDPKDWNATDPYFGAIIGRYGNRINLGRFTLDGADYVLAQNDAGHHACLHGGARGWNAYVWKTTPFVDGDSAGLVLERVSPDGEEGFPGTVSCKVRYTVTPGNAWRIDYGATTDKATPLNLTQHAYFNLDGSDTILDQELSILASSYLPVNADLAPSAAPAPVAGTPFDFLSFHKVGERIDDPDAVLQFGPGYDHNWCLDGEGFRKAAEMRGKSLRMEVWTDQPGLQFYAGNFIDGAWTMKDSRKMHRRSFLALETQHYPDSPNHPEFPSTILKPGEEYRTATEYRFFAR